MTDHLPELPKMYFAKAGKCTYARTYRNEWTEKKDGSGKQAVKRDVKKVGTIDSPSGVGKINFTTEFLLQYPQLLQFNVYRVKNESDTAVTAFTLEFRAAATDVKVPDSPFIVHKKCGATLVFDKLLERDPLLHCLQHTFTQSWDKILSVAYFMLLNPDAKADKYNFFAAEHRLPCPDKLYPSKLSRLFAAIDDGKIMSFFSRYLKELTVGKYINTHRFWAMDSTSLSTYSHLPKAAYGNNKQDESLPQLNLLALTDTLTSRPLFYQIFNGSIPDLASCTCTFETLLNLGAHSFVAVADRGFFSKHNLAAIHKLGYHFVICVPHEKATSYQPCIDEAVRAFASDNLFDLASGLNVYTCKEQVTVAPGVTAYAHVFFNRVHAAADNAFYQRRLKEVEKLYTAKQELTPETEEFLQDNFNLESDGTLSLKKDVYQRTANNAGIFMVLSDSIKQPRVAARAYRSRNAVEVNFATLKTRMNVKRLRVGTEETLTGKCFVQFVALSLYTLLDRKIRQAKRRDDNLPCPCLQDMLAQLDSVEEYFFPATKSYVVEPISKTARECFAFFRVHPPVSRYEKGLNPYNQQKTAFKPHGEDLKR